MFCPKQSLHYYAFLSSFVHKPYSYAGQLQIFAPESMSGRSSKASQDRHERSKKKNSDNSQSIDEDIQSSAGVPSFLTQPPQAEPLHSHSRKAAPKAGTPPTPELVAEVSRKRDRLKAAEDDDETIVFSAGVSVKKRKIVGGSITMKDGAIAVRHVSAMTRGNMMSRDQNLRDCFFKGVGNFTFKLNKFVHLRSTFRAFEGKDLTNFIDFNVRGPSCRTWINTSLKGVYSEFSDTLSRPGRFKNASRNTQIVFAYDGQDPYWDHFPQRTEMQSLKEWQKSFFLEGDWMVSEVMWILFSSDFAFSSN